MRNTALLFLLPLFACSNGDRTPDGSPAKASQKPARPEPDYITVDHILIGVYQDKDRMRGFRHTEAEAKKLAEDLLAKLKAGADWAELKRQYSDDPPPGGPYSMANFGVPQRSMDDFPRGQMADAFGDVGFALDVGEIGLTEGPSGAQGKRGPKSPFGFHIIKRVK